jgi:hypothetical protein
VTFNQPFTGFYRIACNEPCEAELPTGAREAVVWNVSTLGLYLVLSPPVPEIGDKLRVSFRLTGDPTPITAQCRVVWQNLPFLRGAGQKAPTLPPGCGLQFLALDAADRERIDARVRETYPGTHARPAPRPDDPVA